MKVRYTQYLMLITAILIALAGVSCAGGARLSATAASESEAGFTPESPAADIALEKESSADEAKMMSGMGGDLRSAPEPEKKEIPDGDTGESGDAGGIETARKLATTDVFRTRPPELLSRFASDELEPLPLVTQDIAVVAAGHRARIVMDLVFHNPSSGQVAGTLMIELPEGASPCYLGMYQGAGWEKDMNELAKLKLLNPKSPAPKTLLQKEIRLGAAWQSEQLQADWGELRSARVVNPVQGREVYESITRQRIDPALAEWAGAGKFSTRIFPIPANGYKRVVFAYDRPVPSVEGRIIFPLPLPLESDERTRVTVYSPLTVSGGHTIPAPFRDIRVVAGDTVLEGNTIQGSSGDSDYRKWQYTPDAGFNGSLIFEAEDTNPVLKALVGTDEDVPGRLVHVRYRPEIGEQGTSRETGTALFVLDTSYSAKEELAALSGKMLRAVLEQDSTISRFAVIAFDVRCRSITGGFVSNSEIRREGILGTIENIWLEGATDFSSVLQFLEEDDELAGADTVFLLSDGQITWGVEELRDFAVSFPDLLDQRWICYSFGDEPVNRNLFQVLTRSRGQMVHVSVGQDLESAARAHLQPASRLDAVYTDGQDELVVSGDPVWLYPGEILDMAIRVSRNVDEITLTARVNGNSRSVSVPLAVKPLFSSIAARAWADLYAKRLLDLLDEEADRIVLALSQRFSLTNRQASFIILETDEEYVEHRIEKEKLNFHRLTQASLAKAASRPFGAPDTSDLSQESLKLIEGMGSLLSTVVWKAGPPVRVSDTLESLIGIPAERGKDTPTDLYRWARGIYESDKEQTDSVSARALRALSTIVELKPRDDNALRLVGYVLMQWSMYREAEALFARVRRRRPFEPQNYLMEAMTLTAQGKLKEAAVRYEICLQREFPRFDYCIKPSAERLYGDLLEAVIDSHGGTPAADMARRRLEELTDRKHPKGRLFLFWNLDDTDVDLHVQESRRIEISYSNMTSITGSELFWDNTDGLGPELYEHPKLSKSGFEVYVNYFGSSSIEGEAPAATLVAAFKYDSEKAMYSAGWYATVLVGAEEDKVAVMPLWIR